MLQHWVYSFLASFAAVRKLPLLIVITGIAKVGPWSANLLSTLQLIKHMQGYAVTTIKGSVTVKLPSDYSSVQEICQWPKRSFESVLSPYLKQGDKYLTLQQTL